MARVGSYSTKKFTVIVTAQCIAILSGCGNGLSFGKGTYSNNSLSRASRASGISNDANRVSAEKAELKRFCDLTGHRPARIVFTLANSLETTQLAGSVNNKGTGNPDERDEKLARSAVKKLNPELRALQRSLDQVKETNSAALSKSPAWPGTEVELNALRSSQDTAVQLAGSESEITGELDLEDPELTLQRNLNENPRSPLLYDILYPLISSLNPSAGGQAYSNYFQQQAADRQSSRALNPIIEANRIFIMIVARSAARPSSQDIALGRSLFGENNFYVVYSEQAASEPALLLKTSDSQNINGDSTPTPDKAKLQRAKDGSAELDARLSDRKYSFTASQILAEPENLPADPKESESTGLNQQLSAAVEQALSCSDK